MKRMVRSLPDNSTFTWKDWVEIIIGKYSHTAPTECASHCLNLLQKDLMKLDTLQSFYRRTKEMIKLAAAQREARRKEYDTDFEIL